MANLLKYIQDKWTVGPLAPHLASAFTDRTIIVTGANTGLGLEAARYYVQLGAKTVIIAVRSLAKGEEAQQSIEESTGKKGVVQVYELDYGSYASITAFVKRVEVELPRLDVVLLNAGVITRQFQLEKEGYETQLQVNVLSTTLLALLLLPKLRASKQAGVPDASLPHLSIVGSGVHKIITHFPEQEAADVLSALNTPNYGGVPYDGQTRYQITKLFEMYVLKGLEERVNADDVVINVVSPGVCVSDLGREYNSPLEKVAVTVFMALAAKSTEEGSRSLVSATGVGKDVHGQYWQREQIESVGSLVTSEEGKQLQLKVWAEILQLLREKVPEVDGVL